MAATAAHPLVEQEQAARSVDRLGKSEVVLLGEVGLTGMGPPQQAAQVDPAPHELVKHAAELGARTVKSLIGVALPIGQPHGGARLEVGQRRVKAGEVGSAVHMD